MPHRRWRGMDAFVVPLFSAFEGRTLMKRFLPATALLLLTVAAPDVRHARAGQPVVPGTGEWLKDCGDDFEDPKWSYRYNFPKSSHEQDENQRPPGGISN